MRDAADVFLRLCVLSQDDPELSFTDEDYRKRRAHPHFKQHLALEKLVVKMGKTVSPTSPSQTSPA